MHRGAGQKSLRTLTSRRTLLIREIHPVVCCTSSRVQRSCHRFDIEEADERESQFDRKGNHILRRGSQVRWNLDTQSLGHDAGCFGPVVETNLLQSKPKEIENIAKRFCLRQSVTHLRALTSRVGGQLILFFEEDDAVVKMTIKGSCPRIRHLPDPTC